MEQCKVVAQHQKDNGGTDLIWLEKHIKACLVCQNIMKKIKQELAHERGEQ